MTLHQGLNRQIPAACAAICNLTEPRAFVRVAQGPLRLGVMKPGEARETHAPRGGGLEEGCGDVRGNWRGEGETL